MRLMLALGALLCATPALGQPSTPCTPNSTTTLNEGDTISMWKCAANGQSWTAITYGGGSGGGVPSGAIVFVDSGACPAGYAEATELSGKTIIGTTAANQDVGTTGGSDTITPAGNLSAPSFTGTAWSAPAMSWPAGVPTFTGQAFSSVINHTHTVTVNDPGHVHPEGYRNTGTAGTAGVQGASTANNASIAGGVLSATTGITATTANPAGGVASITPAGTIAWPAGVPTIGAYTPSGSVSAPTFTGTQFDNRSAWIKVIACRKT